VTLVNKENNLKIKNISLPGEPGELTHTKKANGEREGIEVEWSGFQAIAMAEKR